MRKAVLLFMIAGGCADQGDRGALPRESPPRHEAVLDDQEALPGDHEADRLGGLLLAPDLPIDAERIEGLGPSEATLAALERRYADPRATTYERTRIVSALRHLDLPGAEAFLERVLRDDSTSVFVRRVAIKSYGRRPRALPLVASFANDDDRHTREAVLRALAQIDTPEARALLATRAQADEAPDLRALAARLVE